MMSEIPALPPQIIEQTSKMMAMGQLNIPPPIFLDMDGEFVTIDLEEKKLAVRFPVKERYQNPMGNMQGGMIATAVDNAIGPLSFMVAPPNVTKRLQMSYIKPIHATLSHIIVEAQFEGKNGRELTFLANVLDEEGNLLAQGKSINVIIRQPD
ncbi:MAG: PaaI family thioesterase [Ardenticatenaceae bacterium]